MKDKLIIDWILERIWILLWLLDHLLRLFTIKLTFCSLSQQFKYMEFNETYTAGSTVTPGSQEPDTVHYPDLGFRIRSTIQIREFMPPRTSGGMRSALCSQVFIYFLVPAAAG